MKPELRVEGGGGTGGGPALAKLESSARDLSQRHLTMPPETLQRPPAPLPLRIYTNPFIEEHPSGTLIVKRAA